MATLRYIPCTIHYRQAQPVMHDWNRMVIEEPGRLMVRTALAASGIPVAKGDTTGRVYNSRGIKAVVVDWGWIARQFGITKKELATRLGVTPQTISNWCCQHFLPSNLFVYSVLFTWELPMRKRPLKVVAEPCRDDVVV